MKKSGFTLVELLAVLIIIGLLVILTFPAYTTIYAGIRRENHNSKINEIKAAALKYGSSIKDEVKDAPGRCIDTNVDELITKGKLLSESESSNVIYSPIDNKPLDAKIKICYNIPKFDIEAFYVVEFDENKYYYKNDMVLYQNPSTKQEEIYKCVINYPAKGGIYATNDKSKKYFIPIKY